MLTAEQSRANIAHDQSMSGSIHLIIFKLGEEEFGIPIEQVKEVTVTPPISRMPKSPPFIMGVANIRGDIIAIMDLEDRFNIIRDPQDVAEWQGKQTYTLVTEVDQFYIGLIVREVPQSLYVPLTNLEKAPEMIHSLLLSEKYVDKIAKLGDRLIIVLDLKKILSQDELKQLA